MGRDPLRPHSTAGGMRTLYDCLLYTSNREQPVDQTYVPMDLVKIEDVLSGDVVKVKYSGTRANRTATEALGKMLEAAM